MLTRRYDVVNFHGTEEQSVCWSHRKPATQCPPDTLLVPFHATFRWNDRAYLWLQAHSAINAAFSTKMGFRSAKCANDLPPPPYTACFILWVLSQLAGVAKRSKANQPGLLDKSLVNRERERERARKLYAGRRTAPIRSATDVAWSWAFHEEIWGWSAIQMCDSNVYRSADSHAMASQLR